MSLETKRKETLKLYDELKSKIDISENEETKNALTKAILEQIQDRIKEIKEFCEVEKYDLYFNGEVGVGKTTFISKIFNLIDYNKLVKNSKLSSALLLATGSGRTTVCEVQIVPNKEKSKICLEPVETEEFYIRLKDFCESLEQKLKGKIKNDEKEEISIAAEEKKLIKNMILKDKKADDDKEFLQQIGLNENSTSEEIFNTIKNIINYENRTQTTFEFESGDFKNWLKNTFSEINLGKNDNAPLPKKVVIELNNNDLDIEVPSYINSIVDTRGIDTGIRKDIEDNMSLKNSISFMCEKISTYGSEKCLEILSQKLKSPEKDIQNRVVLLGLERGTELEDVEGADSYEEGKQQKIREAKDNMYSSRVIFNADNFWLLNSISGIEASGTKIIEVNENVMEEEQKRFFNNIENLIEKMYEKYSEELKNHIQISNTLLNISDEEEAEVKNIENIVNEIREHLQNVLTIELENNNYLKTLENRIDIKHASTIRAMVNRNGVYDSFNYYITISKILKDEFEKFYDYKRANIDGYLAEKFKNIEQYEKDNNLNLKKITLDFINEEINKDYLDCINNLEKNSAEKSKELLYNDAIWDKLYGYWGDSEKRNDRGYKVAIKEDLIEKTDLEELKALKNMYVEKLKEKILEALKLEGR